MAVMDATGIGILAVMLSISFPIFLFLWGRWQKSKLTKAKQWPRTEATIQTGAIEVVAPDLGSAMRLPVFAFSYQVGGEYYSGRFALMPYTVQIRRLAGQSNDRSKTSNLLRFRSP